MELVVIQEDTQHQAVEAPREDKAEADIQEHHPELQEAMADKAEADIQEHHQEFQEAMADRHMQEHTWPEMLTQATP